MSALSDALTAMKDRIASDFAKLRAELDTALGNDAADQAEIARVTGIADGLQADIDSAISEIGTVDPDPANPPAEPPQ